MPPSNPFDFSDFGSRASAVSGSMGGVPQSGNGDRRGGLATNGFDPFAGQPPVSQQSATAAQAFAGTNRGSAGSLSVSRPPTLSLAAACAVAVIGVASGIGAVFASAVLLAFGGWLLAGPAAIGVLAWFTHADIRRRLSSVYSTPTWLTRAYWLVVTICAVGIGIGAWQIALWAGRW